MKIEYFLHYKLMNLICLTLTTDFHYKIRQNAHEYHFLMQIKKSVGENVAVFVNEHLHPRIR